MNVENIEKKMDKKTVRYAISGLGRIGRYHSMNISTRVANAELVAGCTIMDADKQWVKENLPHLRIYDDYDEMLEKEKGSVDAVAIASSTAVHAEQSIKAIEAGYHVFCEKPLSLDVDEAAKVVETAKAHPKQKVLCGFSRRFDASYLDAKKKVDEGLIGKPMVIKAQTGDKQHKDDFFVKYAEKSGGIFVDCTIHDIDLVLYYFGEDVVPQQISAIGSAVIHPELAKFKDCDNAFANVKFWDGRMANFYVTRMMTHGQEDYTEILGTEAKITVNKNVNNNLVTISDPHGVRHEAPEDFYARFEMAFVTELNEFTKYIVNDKPVPFSLDANLKALKWAKYLQHCVETGKVLNFNEKGEPIDY